MTADLAKLPPDLRKRVAEEISLGEKVLYAGRPDWRALTGQLLILVAFGFFWSMLCFPMAFFVWGEALGFGPDDPKQRMGSGLAIFFSIFMVPFVVIGAAMLASPFYAARRTARTVHVVTDQRLINVIAGAKTEIESFKLEAINFIKRRDGKAGKGSLSIGYGVEKDSDGDTRPLTTDWPGIPDVRRAELVIRSAASHLKPRH
ncbi:MAG: hypothetical protein ACKVP4_09245 [Hyphomicrobium sp.]